MAGGRRRRWAMAEYADAAMRLEGGVQGAMSDKEDDDREWQDEEAAALTECMVEGNDEGAALVQQRRLQRLAEEEELCALLIGVQHTNELACHRLQPPLGGRMRPSPVVGLGVGQEQWVRRIRGRHSASPPRGVREQHVELLCLFPWRACLHCQPRDQRRDGSVVLPHQLREGQVLLQ